MAGTWSKLKKLLAHKLSFTLRHQSAGTQPPPLDPDLSLADMSASDSRTPTPRSTSSSLSHSRFSRSFTTGSHKRTCTICLGNVKTGHGQAIFTAECSHSFHFGCIAKNVKHGNRVCPICRSKWKDIPFQFSSNNPDPQRNIAGRARVSPYQGSPNDVNMNIISPSPPSPSYPEPMHLSDDEPLFTSDDSASITLSVHSHSITVKSIPELPAIAASESVSSFAVLVGLRAPSLLDDARHCERAPIDLVTVLDVSGSMAGSKLSLLKRAVRFVIENLGPSDRLSIVTFSSGARRIFPLRRMSDRGREEAVIAVNSLSSNGGTNIVEGLKKGFRVIKERRERNPVVSIILLSDGRDTYNCVGSQGSQYQTSSNPSQVLNYMNLLLPFGNCGNGEARNGAQPVSLPVHTFGLGSDHDSASMHAISDASGGTFSFVESIGMVQDAFARCIGGLLSVVAQQLRLTMTSASQEVLIGSIPSGKYLSEVSEQGKKGVIDVGDLYADEEKEFLVYLSVPASFAAEEMAEKTSLLDVQCSYKNPLLKDTVRVDGGRLEVHRPKILSPADVTVSVEVDRQRNRLWVAEGIAEAKEMAETGNLQGAQAVLTNRRATLLSSASAQARDGLCIWLEAELMEIRERMASMELYEQMGRAYVLSGLSCHSWQRATTRGDSTTRTMSLDGVSSGQTTRVLGYDTPTMTTMVSKSQNLSSLTNPSSKAQKRPNKSSNFAFRK